MQQSHMNKRILIISPIATHPLNHGNKQRVHTLLLNLRELGNDIYFVHIRIHEGDEKAMWQCWGEKFYPIPYKMPKAYFSKERDYKIAREIYSTTGFVNKNSSCFTYLLDDIYDNSIDASIIDLSKRINPNVVIVEYVFLSKALECFDKDVLKIIDTHDIFADRSEKFFNNKQFPPNGFSTTEEQENKGLSRADIIIAIQKNEANLFKNRLSSKKIAIVGHTVSLQRLKYRKLTNKILFFGSANSVNNYSIRYFIKDIFPLIKERFRNAELILAGEICERLIEFDDCLKLGKVDNLKDVYDMADVVINPVLVGTGLKIKNIEALGYLKPLITTALGAEGLEEGIGKAFLIAESPEDFLDCITKIFTDNIFYESLCRNAYNFVREYNQKCLNALKEIFYHSN